jgi:hypothetical protein
MLAMAEFCHGEMRLARGSLRDFCGSNEDLAPDFTGNPLI